MPTIMKKRGISRKDIQEPLTEARFSELKNQLARMKTDYEGNVDEDGFKVKQEKDPEIAQQIAHLEAYLAANAPGRFRAEELNKLNARRKELEEKIKTNMPTRNDLWKVPGKDGYRADMALDNHMKWEEQNRHLIEEWQHIMRVLEPQNRHADNVETLRRDA